MSSLKKKLTQTLPGLLIGAALVAVVLSRVDFARAWRVILDARPIYLLPVALLLSVHYVVKGFRWRALLKAEGRLPAIPLVRFTLIGFMMNNVLPARIGELVRPYLLSNTFQSIPIGTSLASLLADKVFDLLAVLACLLIGLTAFPQPDWVAKGILVLMGISVLCMFGALLALRRPEKASGLLERLLALLPDSLADRARGLFSGFSRGLSPLVRAGTFFPAMAWNLVIFGVLAGSVWCTGLVFGLELTASACLFNIGMIGIGFAMPAPPTHAGNFHFFAAQALVLTGADWDVALPFAITAHLSQVVVVSVLGLAALPGTRWRKLKQELLAKDAGRPASSIEGEQGP